VVSWFDVAAVADFGVGESRLLEVDNVMVAVFNLDGEYHAIEDVCTHAGAPMLGCGLGPEELIDGEQIICPRHGARFCIRTGRALTPPAFDPVYKLPIRIESGMVQVADDRSD